MLNIKIHKINGKCNKKLHRREIRRPMHRSIGDFNAWIRNTITPRLRHVRTGVRKQRHDTTYSNEVEQTKRRYNVDTTVRCFVSAVRLTVMQMSHNYHYQSKICGNPFPRLNYLKPLARTQSDVDHRFSCKRRKY